MTKKLGGTVSYIDCYRHQVVGLFGNLPVYRPLEDIIGSSDPRDGDFQCTSKQLVLGGGSGEHPGLVLLCPDRAVAEFVISNPELVLADEQEKSIWDQFVRDKPTLSFSGWSSADHHDFYRLCTKGTLQNKFDPDGDVDFETWLMLGFGEFLFYSIPELAQGFLSELKPFQSLPHHIYFNNILVIPPRMPVYANGGNAFFSEQ